MVHLSEIASTIDEEVFLTRRPGRVDVQGAVVFVSFERAEAAARVNSVSFGLLNVFHGPS